MIDLAHNALQLQRTYRFLKSLLKNISNFFKWQTCSHLLAFVLFRDKASLGSPGWLQTHDLRIWSARTVNVTMLRSFSLECALLFISSSTN